MSIVKDGAQLGDKELTLETGRMARQAGGSVVIQYGDSQVLCTATAGGIRPLPFFPLVCDYIENRYAAGVIPGGYFRREARPGDKAVLTARLIDRPCRPLFPDDFKNETQLLGWVISADMVNDTDVLAITGCSAALMISDIPWNGPVAAVRVGRINGEFVSNPTFEQREHSDMDIVVVSMKNAIVMVEGIADELPEDVMIDALEYAQKAVDPLLDLQIRLAKAVGKKKKKVVTKDVNKKLVSAVEKVIKKDLAKAVKIPTKMERYAKLDELKDVVVDKLADDFPDEIGDLKDSYGSLKKKLIRESILTKSARIDGRGLEDIREITVETGLLPKAHGSALFTRGETQALVTATLGTGKDAQRMDTLEGDITRRFMLHYNFPPFSVGEAKGLRGTSRREIGHGYLAERGLMSAIPNLEDGSFPYTVRIVSDVFESNGSSSMASVCGGSLAMFDAGVPCSAPTAGIAMGLVTDGKKFCILSDILGDEDHVGDMDFKVVGTSKGITAFQLDTKVEGLPRKVMQKALFQARDGINHILDCMAKGMAEPRAELSANSPRIIHIKVDPGSIGAIIGSGGSTIRGIQEATGAAINIDDDGTVSIAASDGIAAQQAIEIIEGLTATPDVGKVYQGVVKKIIDAGAIVDIMPGCDGFLHISEISEGRINKIEDVLKEGDKCLVKVQAVERNGRVKLSRKEALADKMAENNNEPVEKAAAE